MIDGISNDTAVSCLLLSERIFDKYVTNAAGPGVPIHPGKAAFKRKRAHVPRHYRYHKFNPMPPAVVRRIVARVQRGEPFKVIALDEGVSMTTVSHKAIASGICRGRGWKGVAA